MDKELFLNEYSNELLTSFYKILKKNKVSTHKTKYKLLKMNHLLNFIRKIQHIYYNLVKSDSYVNKLLSSACDDNGNFRFNIFSNNYKTKSDESNGVMPNNFDSMFMAKKPSNIIKNKKIYVVEVIGKVCDVNINIKFYSIVKWFLNKTKSQQNIYEKIVRILRRVVFMINFFDKSTCNNGEKLVMDLFLVDAKKHIPTYRQFNLDQESINSGYTSFFNDANQTKTIIIYRDEEMEKLIIHELIHFFILDFKNLNFDLSSILNIPKSLELIPNESFTEFITMIIHPSLIAIESKYKGNLRYSKKFNGQMFNTNNFYVKLDMKQMLNNTIDILVTEITFGFFQCAKILVHYNIGNASDFFTQNNESKPIYFYQKSCIISYFFIKVSLLFNIGESFPFYMNNQIDLNIRKDDYSRNLFESLVKNSLQKKDYQTEISSFMNIFRKQLFTKKLVKKIKQKCKTQKGKSLKNKCFENKSRKLRYNNYEHIVTNTRMSIIEL